MSKVKQVAAMKGLYNQLIYKKSFDKDYDTLITQKEKNDADVRKYI